VKTPFKTTKDPDRSNPRQRREKYGRTGTEEHQRSLLATPGTGHGEGEPVGRGRTPAGPATEGEGPLNLTPIGVKTEPIQMSGLLTLKVPEERDFPTLFLYSEHLHGMVGGELFYIPGMSGM
jgi:hypothetical protein